jgi:ribosomal protein L12E/L44/L45/RPP1/RPP2
LVKEDTTGKFGARLVVTFEPSGMMLSLNKTSVGNLLRDLGEESDNWIGQTVEIFVGEVTTNNGTMDAILVRAADMPVGATAAAKVAAKTAAKKAAKKADMDDMIPF